MVVQQPTWALRCPSCARSLKMYNNLVERCFRECVEDMRSKTLSSKEEQVCVGMHGARALPLAWCICMRRAASNPWGELQPRALHMPRLHRVAPDHHTAQGSFCVLVMPDPSGAVIFTLAHAAGHNQSSSTCTLTLLHSHYPSYLLTFHLQCTAKCCEKFMNVTGRVGMRFGEFFSQMEAAAQAQMQEMAKQQQK